MAQHIGRWAQASAHILDASCPLPAFLYLLVLQRCFSARTPFYKLLVYPQHIPTPHFSSSPSHTVLEGDPVLLVNTSSVAENMDSVSAFCSTSATRIVWYVNALRVSSNDKMTISPDGKTLIMHWVNRYDITIQCGVYSSFGSFPNSEMIFLTVARKWSGVMGVKPRVGLGSPRDGGMRQDQREVTS